MLARGPASEVRACREYRRALKARLIQLKAGLRRAVGIESPVIEQKLAEAATFYSLQELFWNYLIGIDVDSIKRRNQPSVF